MTRIANAPRAPWATPDAINGELDRLSAQLAAAQEQMRGLTAAMREVLLSRDVSLNGSAGADVAAYWEDCAEEAAAMDDPEGPRPTSDHFRGRALDRARAALAKVTP